MTQLAFYVVSDVHGYIFPTNYQESQQQLPMGLLHAKQLIEQDQVQYPHHILIDNGDFLQGSPLGHYLAKELGSSQKLADIYNHFGFDVGIIGNHEFNFGLSYLRETLDKLQFPILSANILQDGRPFTGHGVYYIERAGLKIGIIGLTTQYVPHWEQAAHIEGLTFESAVATLERWLPEVRAKVDIVAVCYHGGFERALGSGEPTEALTGENEGYALLERFHSDIDLLITGHQHRQIAETVHGVPVIQPGTKGEKVGKIVLDIEGDQIQCTEVSLLANETLTPVPDPNPDFQQKMAAFDAEVDAWLDIPIAHLQETMQIEDPLLARTQPHPYINFLNYILMEVSDAQIAASALFDLSQGFGHEVTMRDVLNNYPFPNTFNVLEVSGQDIKDALEQTAEYFAVENGEVIVNPQFIEPKPQHYNYDIYSGIDYTIKVSNPVGQRITQLEYQGEPLQMAQTYTLALNNYRAVGGGNYSMFTADKIVKDIQIEGAQLIIDYLQQHPELKIPNITNFKVEV
ncbi:bifunctional UDP-sugar hydrolase/5'-nucleotidase [Staphylococcus debuckii]|uniref:Bifunctional UDP-sugar hydrolase/5'-nucleotidase n=1 Tax=Staphylococcus debuckii TaxID=2044912 RepID=A0ABU9EV45_9STAP